MPLFFTLFALALVLPVLWPQIDLFVSGLFYREGGGFFLADNPVLVAVHWLASDGAKLLGLAFTLLAFVSFWYAKNSSPTKAAGTPPFLLDTKAWLFLLLALIIAPGLVANVGFKDHWGRDRPREIVEFGGTRTFSPALVPHFENARSNGSFVSGDGAFGFFLPVFAYVAPRRSSRRVFWGTMLTGVLFGATRIMMGAHFFSDVLFAAFFMLASVACLHAAMYGRRQTSAYWREWLQPKKGNGCASTTQEGN